MIIDTQMKKQKTSKTRIKYVTYMTKQKPQGVFEFLSNPMTIFLISPHLENKS